MGAKTNRLEHKRIIELFRFKAELVNKGEKISGEKLREKFSLSDREGAQYLFVLENCDDLEKYFAVSQDLKNKKINSTLSHEKAKVKQLEHAIEYLELQNEFLLSIQDDNFVIPEIKETPHLESEAVAIAILSDVHSEENVDPDTIYQLNEYNLQICEQRVGKFFTNFLKLVNKERQDIAINKCVLGLLGDNITGYIHEELKESNGLSPTEATIFVKGLLMAGLKLLVDEGNFTEIVVPCCKGNHGRTTKEKRHATAYKNSFEWMLYHDMANTFQVMGGQYAKILKFEIPKSELTYIKVFDKTLRFGHGDHFKFMGGVGGLAIPLMKWLYRVNAQREADMTFIGHWHQKLQPAANCLINGSIIGFNAYAAAIGAKAEPPMQQFILLDKNRGWTVNTPILCQ